MSDDIKLSRALNNAQHALAQLRLFLGRSEYGDLEKAGVIQAFEFTFEATWKLLQKYSESQGLSAPSPKKALMAAYQGGFLSDERVWLDMLDDRNLTSHTYNRVLADAIFERISQRYASAFADAIERLAREVSSG